MADKRISDLVEFIGTPANNDVIPLVDTSANETKKATYGTLLTALKEGIRYGEVSTYADLPLASEHNGEIYVVLQGTGIYIINRKSAGLYLSNGSTWDRLGNTPSFFSSANFRVYDNTDNSKKVSINTASITPGNIRDLTIPDKNGTIALTNDWGWLTDNIIYNGTVTAVAGGDVYTASLNSTLYYRFVSSTLTIDGYPDDDSIYSGFDGVNLTGLIASRGVA